MSDLLSTESVLHPTEVAEINLEKAQISTMLDAPPHIRSQIQDSKGMAKRLRDANERLKQAPKVIPETERDAAVALEAQLREDWLIGMPTQAEMRRKPPGAVKKNIDWERRAKSKVLAWKRIRREMHQSGMLGGAESDASDISNIEMFRPHEGPGEMSMDGAQIPGQQFQLSPPGAGPAAVFTDANMALLRSVEPGLADSLAILPNDARRRILDALRDSRPASAVQPSSSTGLPPETAPAAKRKKRASNWSPERRKAFGEKMKALKAAKKLAEKEA